MARGRALTTLVLSCALVGVLALTACEDEPTPEIADPTPSPSASATTASASPSPSESLSATPEALTPEETVRAWVDAWNAALDSGDTRALGDLETADCLNCSSLAEVITDVMSAGGSFKGGKWSVVKLSRTDDPRPVTVVAALRVAAGSSTSKAGADPVSFEADRRLARYGFTDKSGVWLISSIELLS